jgi:hypothetical protein
VLLAASAALLLARPAAAALFRAATVEDAARGADAVVRAVVQGQVSRPSADGSRIVTDVTLAVRSAWKGAPGPVVRVTIPGGAVDGVHLWVDGAPRFDDGEEVVVFLVARGAAWRVGGLALGKWTVAGADAIPAIDPGDLRPGDAQALAAARPAEAVIAPMALAELERRVRGTR